MAGLLDDPSNPGPSDAGALYGNLLSQQQRQALAYRGLLAAAGALGQAAMPSRMPVPLGAALGSAAGALGSAQDQGALNAMRGNLLGLQGQQLAWRMGLGNQFLHSLQQMGQGGGQGGFMPTAPAGTPPVPGAAPTPGAPSAPQDRTPTLASVVSGGQIGPLTDFVLKREGGSPQGVENNPGNIKFTGAPGQTDSGVKATDGGTFASYATPEQGRAAVDGLITRAAQGAIPAYGKSPTVQSFLNTYEGKGGAPAPAAQPAPPTMVPGGMATPNLSGAMQLAALGDLAGFPSAGQMMMNSPQWQAATAAAKAQATLPAQYAAPGANPALQQQLAAAKARGEYAGPTADVNLQSQLATAKAAAGFAGPAGVGTLRQGGTAFNKQTGQPVYAAPYIREVVDRATGQTHYQWDYPPGAPNAPGAAAAPTQGNLVPGMPSPSAAAQGAPAASAAAGNAQLGNQPLGPLAKLSPQRVEEMKGVGEEAAKTREEIIDEANAAQAQQANLETMKADAAQFYTGPFANHYAEAQQLLRLINPSEAQNLKVASYEDFNKSAGQLIRSTVREQSSRAAVQEFKLITQQLPNAEMSPQGLGYVVDDLMGINDYRIAKAQAQHAWEQRPGSQGPGDVSGFETDWQKQVTPYAFMFARMDPTRRQAIISTVAKQPGGADELSHLAQQVKYAQQYEQFIQ